MQFLTKYNGWGCVVCEGLPSTAWSSYEHGMDIKWLGVRLNNAGEVYIKLSKISDTLGDLRNLFNREYHPIMLLTPKKDEIKSSFEWFCHVCSSAALRNSDIRPFRNEKFSLRFSTNGLLNLNSFTNQFNKVSETGVKIQVLQKGRAGYYMTESTLLPQQCATLYGDLAAILRGCLVIKQISTLAVKESSLRIEAPSFNMWTRVYNMLDTISVNTTNSIYIVKKGLDEMCQVLSSLTITEMSQNPQATKTIRFTH